jgi:hypothetical protein
MVELERTPGQAVQIGRYTLRVLAVREGEVVVALLDPDKDCVGCGQRGVSSLCPACQTVMVVCPDCVRSWRCPFCASAWGA